MPGLETYTPEDIQRVQRLLQTPQGEEELERWIKDWINQHLLSTDASQLIGEIAYDFLWAEIDTEETTSSTSFGNLATIGPQLSGLSAGKWHFWWGAQCRNTGASDSNAQLGVETSWSGLSDSNVASTRIPVGVAGKNAAYGRGFNDIDGPKNPLSGQNVTVKYRVTPGSTAGFQKRWIVGVKTGEL